MNDFQAALRNLVRTPGAVLAIVLILGLGIGVNASVFSLYKAVLLDSLFFGASEDLVLLEQRIETEGAYGLPFSVKEVADYRNMSESLVAVEEQHGMSFTLLGLEAPQHVQTGVVSAGYFDMLDVKPLLGRTFRPDEDTPGSPPTIVLSHHFWKEKAGADPGIIGRSLVMNDKAHEVIGVLAPNMDLAVTDAYVTTPHCPTRSSEIMIGDRDMRMMAVFARKRPDVSMTQLRAELNTIADRLAAEYPESYPDGGRYTVRAEQLHEAISGSFRSTGLLLMLVSGLILLAALANVSNLTLARTARMENELSIRAALGASRARLARLLFVEHALLGLIGGVVGIGFAALTTRLLAQFATRLNPLAARATLDVEVLAYALLLSLAVGIVAGVLPVIRLGRNAQPLRAQMGARSTTASVRSQRTRDGLIVVQIALTLVVLTASLMMLRSLANLNSVQPGFTVENVLSARVTLNPARYQDAGDRIAFSDRLLERLRGAPGVTHVALASVMPMESTEAFNSTRIALPDEPNRDSGGLPVVDYRIANESYFGTMNIPLLRGRGIERYDDADAPPVVVVNRTLAEAVWPGEDAVGKRILPEESMFIGGETTSYEVIGVVDDVRQYGPRQPEGPAFYVPVRQAGYFGRIVLRGGGDVSNLRNVLRDALRDIDPQQPVDRVLTMVEIQAVAVQSTELLALLLNIFAALVLAIAVVGLGGLIAFNVTQRLREFSIRLAVGAQHRDLYRLVLRYSTWLLAFGSIVGLAGALLIGRGLQEYLYEVAPLDPLSIALSIVLLFIIGSLAVLIPARRIGKLQPAEILSEQ
ncbi:MAG TPA: ABC transporter permease [Gammaproteobacteria bacterium]